METEIDKTIVIFRVDKKDGDVFALFPFEIADDLSHVLSYQHIGQHCAADYIGCIKRSRAARPDEYKDLERELAHIGYNLAIRKRA